ncbi:hypothetical protein FYK34_06175 [Chromobacterium paludis]|uniref:Transcription factor zinc-finger domain-containing protein n=1 Tax=Chromobacterium paludis TaxID=2605945 RepID=A0A5C1DEG6_9NEIS|nr:hypothetical protein FYK34_06175 [Chromobacterium paludis]
MTACPRCQQGEIKAMMLRKTKQPIWVCEECDAAWLNNEISFNSFEDYGIIMKRMGLPPLWSELS